MDKLKRFAQIVKTVLCETFEETRDWVGDYLLRRPLLITLAVYVAVLLVLKSLGFFDRPAINDPSHWAGNRIVLTGVVMNQPDPRPRGTVYVLRAETIGLLNRDSSRQLQNGRHSRFRGNDGFRNSRGKSLYSVNGLVYLQVSGAGADRFCPDDRLQVIGKLSEPKRNNIPGVFDYNGYLRDRGIFCQMFTGSRCVKNLGPSKTFSLKRWGWDIHREVVQIFSKYLEPENAAVLAGLTVGDRPRFHPEIKRIFVESGTMHILVASGSNVAFLVGVWFIFTRLIFRLSRRMAVLSSLPAIWFYVLVVGGDPPIFRAGLMATVGIIAYILAREDRAFHSLTMAGFAILLLNPRTLFDVGFQMSYVTVFGLIFFIPKIQSLILRAPPFWRWALFLATSTITAQIWLWPINAAVFKRFYPISLVANILVIPLAAGGLLAGLFLLGFHFIYTHAVAVPHLLSFIQLVSSWYLHFLIVLVRFFADYPGKNFWLASPTPLFCAGFYLGCLSIGGLRRFKVARFGLVTGLIFMVVPEFIKPKPSIPSNNLSMTWLKRSRHSSVLIQDGKTRLLFISPERELGESLQKVLMPFLSEMLVKKLNAVIFTRPLTNQKEAEKIFSRELTVEKFLPSSEESRVISIPPFSIELLPGVTASSREKPFLIRHPKTNILLSYFLPTKTQQYLLEKGPRKIGIIQSRFADNQRWKDDFIKKYSPEILVEMGAISEYRTSHPPWKGVDVIAIQKNGFYEWRNAK